MRKTSDLDMLIALAYSEGFSRFGDLDLEPQVFSNRIRAILLETSGHALSPGTISAFMLRLHATDLYLATACAQHATRIAGAPNQRRGTEQPVRAWSVFTVTYKDFIEQLSRLFTAGQPTARDLTDAVLDYFLLPGDSGTARIAGYDGRSSLHTWLRVLVRQASSRFLAGPPEDINATLRQTASPPADAGERAYSGAERPALVEAIRSALMKLAPKERLVLLWHYKDSLSLERIAQLLGMERSRLPRFLERSQSKLAGHAAKLLGDQDGISVDSIPPLIHEMPGEESLA